MSESCTAVREDAHGERFNRQNVRDRLLQLAGLLDVQVGVGAGVGCGAGAGVGMGFGAGAGVTIVPG